MCVCMCVCVCVCVCVCDTLKYCSSAPNIHVHLTHARSVCVYTCVRACVCVHACQGVIQDFLPGEGGELDWGRPLKAWHCIHIY